MSKQTCNVIIDTLWVLGVLLSKHAETINITKELCLGNVDNNEIDIILVIILLHRMVMG